MLLTQTILELESFKAIPSAFSPDYSVRIRQQDESICAAGTAQHVGWLDAGPKHMFIWHFASQSNEESNRLTVCLNDRPGTSSMLSPFQETGSCLINEYGILNNTNTAHNPYTRAQTSSLLFMDQPVDVNFSYINPGHKLPHDSQKALPVDMRPFLQLFISKVFTHKHNAVIHLSGNPGVLAPAFNRTGCDIMAGDMHCCMTVKSGILIPPYTRPRSLFAMMGHSHGAKTRWAKGGRNRYDVTDPCEIDSMCYAQTVRIKQYLNSVRERKAISPPDAIYWAFETTPKGMTSISSRVVFLLSYGVDFLAYQGNPDLACTPVESRFTVVTVNKAEHLLPQDRPAVALDTFLQWIADSPLI
ncbi:alpha/beta-hydrolase [Aspergillus sclerotiicarbonarius CBS 121057]|uniref:Alpha/beta-hydrolase n=1 Tax=Aspergillus sclerotiicarbonarius (strain CBS 121057 / IBT 28362) TaxID=1448318 RepID=A0A319EWQ6_ASPSB|nr:alpha/beta-hydrolase [Aspergillus sclerotiicarbonarius CBS 121057]